MASRAARMMHLLRADRSQQKMNDKLGYEYNKYADWERGRTKVLWEDFVCVCDALKIPLKKELYHCYGLKADPMEIRDHFSFFWGNKKQKAIAEGLNMSRDQVRRLMSGQRKLELETVLNIFDLRSDNSHIFIKRIIPNWQEDSEELAPENEVLFKMNSEPWIEVVPRLIELMANKGTTNSLLKLLSKFTRLKEKRLKSIVGELIESKFIEEKKNGTLKRNVRFLDTMPYHREPLAIRSYWQNLITDYVKNRRKKGTELYWGYKIFTCSKEELEKIKDAYMTFYNSIDEVIKEGLNDEKGKDLELYVLNMQLVDLINVLDIKEELKEV